MIMRKIMNNKLLMYWAVIEILAKYKPLWTNIKGFVKAHDLFKAAVEILQITSGTSGIKTEEITAGKNAATEAYITDLFNAMSIVSVFATNNDDMAMKSKVDYVESELKDMRPGELLAVSQEVIAMIKANQVELTDLGLLAEDVTAIESFIENFETITMATRTTITTRKTAGAQLRPQFAVASYELKEKLDKLMEQFRKTQPTFYQEYWNAREKVDYGVRYEKKKEEVKK
jgi:hypothetical protein